MQTTISYAIPDAMLDGILIQLGYSDRIVISKEDFMNEAIKNVVTPAIANVFINMKQSQISDALAKMPSEVHASVSQMLSITTI